MAYFVTGASTLLGGLGASAVAFVIMTLTTMNPLVGFGVPVLVFFFVIILVY